MESWFKSNVLADKTALVIGGSSESGPAVCRILSKHGAKVPFTYHKNETHARDIEKELAENHESKAYPFDLLDMAQVFGLLPEIERDFGRIDILVNLGGPPPVHTDLRELSEKDFDRMMDSHFKGCFFLALEAAKRMESGRGGLIVNVSATSSMKYSHSAYGLAKACVTEMTRFLAYSFAPTVRILTLIPGLIDIKEVDLDLRNARAEASPLKRNVTPEEIAQLVIATASPAFTSITGESIVADAGFWLLHR